MAIFPDIAPNYGYSFIPQYRTDRLPLTDGDYSQRRARRSTPLYKAVCGWSALSAADERTLMAFFDTTYGAYGDFVFFDFVSRPVSLFTLDADASGAQTTYTLEHRDITECTIYFDGVEQSSSIYTVSNRTGANGQDQIIFDSAPGATLIITIKYEGKKYLPICVFDTDELQSALVNYQRHQVAQVTILQVNG